MVIVNAILLISWDPQIILTYILQNAWSGAGNNGLFLLWLGVCASSATPLMCPECHRTPSRGGADSEYPAEGNLLCSLYCSRHWSVQLPAQVSILCVRPADSCGEVNWPREIPKLPGSGRMRDWGSGYLQGEQRPQGPDPIGRARVTIIRVDTVAKEQPCQRILTELGLKMLPSWSRSPCQDLAVCCIGIWSSIPFEPNANKQYLTGGNFALIPCLNGVFERKP